MDNEVKKYINDITFSNKLNDTDLLAPIPDPSKIICLAFNYYDHARDAGLTPSDEPVIFIKPRTALNHPFNDVVCPSFVERLDYEAELAVIIERTLKISNPEMPPITYLDILSYMTFLQEISNSRISSLLEVRVLTHLHRVDLG